jgi:hypothetical protein
MRQAPPIAKFSGIGALLTFGIDAMTLTDSPRRLRSPLIGLLRGFRLTLMVAATAWLASQASSRAEPINYVFVDSSVALSGESEQINGSFTYDPATTTESAVTIKLTGAAPYAATYTQLSPLMFTTSADLIDAFNGNITFQVIFRNDLGPTEDPIFAVNYTDPQANPPTIHVSEGGVTGIAVPVVPEPSSLALLVVALGLFLLLPVLFRTRSNHMGIDPEQA